MTFAFKRTAAQRGELSASRSAVTDKVEVKM